MATSFNVRDHGAIGDGRSVDSPAINAAIDAAARAGGGTVLLPAGTYLCFSLRLKSNITLQLEPGATVLAARPAPGVGHYDPPEPNEWGDVHQYQDFGHSHWHNSLIWGEDLQNIAITGPGLIDGSEGLTRHAGSVRGGPNGTVSARHAGAGPDPSTTGVGNKAIALKNCRNVTLRDFCILRGGHFALLATGVDLLTLDNLKVDTNRDGFDLDNCRNVRVSNCTVNTPNDDAIVLKSGYALGAVRPTENVTIINCSVSGFDVGSVLDGTYRRTVTHAPDRDGPTGRIKLGTESNGGFRNIVIANCTFERSRGLAFETVDGGVIEDVVVTGLTLRETTNAPIFLRIGNRARGPAGTPVGAIRRVKISHVTVNAADGRFPIILAGLPDHPIEDISLSDIHVVSRGGITMDQVAQQPDDLVNAFFLRGNEPGVTGPRDPFAVPERIAAYPEPSMFGLLPAAAIYARHVRQLAIRDFTVAFLRDDERPAVLLDDVGGATFESVRLARGPGQAAFRLQRARDVAIHRCPGLPDSHHAVADDIMF